MQLAVISSQMNESVPKDDAYASSVQLSKLSGCSPETQSMAGSGRSRRTVIVFMIFIDKKHNEKGTFRSAADESEMDTSTSSLNSYS